MSERYKGCWVAFDGDYYEEDAEFIMRAIRMIKGVAETNLHDGGELTHEDWMARSRARQEIADKILDLYKDVTKR